MNIVKIIKGVETHTKKRTLAKGFIITLLLAHAIALAIQILIFMQATTYVYAHPIQSYTAQKDMFFWTGIFIVITRCIEITGLTMKQAWGWFFTQYTYLSALPLFLLSSIVAPNYYVIFITLIYSSIVFLLYLPTVRTLFFPSQQKNFLFIPFVMGINGILFILIEIGKIML